MDKYENEVEEKQPQTSRTARNKSIYSKIDDEDIDNLNLANNISVIETNAEDLDIETIKDILNKKYQEKEKKVETTENFIEEVSNVDGDSKDEEEITKEYDLKKVLETAHKNKPTDYDKERFLKLRETQYDILNSLNIDRKEEPEPEETLSQEEANLMNLIKTVNFNAEKSKELREAAKESDDLLGDLLGDEKTEVLEPVEVDMSVEPDKKPSLAEEIEKTKQLSKKELEDEIDKYNEMVKNDEEEDDDQGEEDDSSTQELSHTEQMSNSFYTGKLHINDRDMDDFADLEKEMKGSVVVKILVIILVLITLAVAVFLLNKYLNLGLF